MSKHKGRIDLCFDDALDVLHRLMTQTDSAIESAHKKGDCGAVAALAFEQRHNLKVLFRLIEKAKK